MSARGYEIIAELKRGGMGEVLLARRLGVHGFERLVAIKTIRGEMRASENIRSMFLDEARLMARLHHPAIAQVHDFSEENGELWLVMEYVAGLPFNELATLSPGPRVCAEAVANVLLGLHAAHEAIGEDGEHLGVVHRDISPQNLMLTYEGDVKILDFGIAWMKKRLAPETELGTLKGKPAYMAPEQLRGQPADRRADLFATAVVLHELLCGQDLFTGTPVEVAAAICLGETAAPSLRNPSVPKLLDEVVLRGLARDPAERFATAEEMARALMQVVDAIPGERLDHFVATRLAPLRDGHREKLRTMPRPPDLGAGRATGVRTLPAVAVDRAPQAQTRWLVPGAIAAVALGGLAAVYGFGAASAPSKHASVRAVASERALAHATSPAPSPAPIASDAQPLVKGTARPTPSLTTTPSAAPSAALEYGFITFGADPYALVRLDGATLGPTPIFKYRVTVGSHSVALVSPDSGAVRLSQSVNVEANKTLSVVAR